MQCPYFCREIEGGLWEVVYYDKVMATAYDFQSAQLFVTNFNRLMEKKTGLKHWDFWDWRKL